MRNGGLDEAQAGIKIARRNINNLRYADDTTLWKKVTDFILLGSKITADMTADMKLKDASSLKEKL